MKSSICFGRARERIESDVKRRLAQRSNFACSICGAIPIVFHHIKEWSKNFSNDEDLLIPICDKCHRGIHGEGGTIFSKDELYEYKANPKRPSLLSDKLPLERKKTYSYFIGSNFVASGTKVSLFGFQKGYNLLSIDTSTGFLKLNILAEVQDGKEIYLIKDNELLINTKDVWDMRYSRSSLKIWRVTGDNKVVFIDLVIKPDVIIIKEINTAFDGKPFRIYRLRKPQQRQVEKIANKVQQYEELYRKLAAEIENRPQVGGVFGGLDVDVLIKETQKQSLKTRMEQELNYGFCHEFDWDWPYYQWVLSQVLRKSPVFGEGKDVLGNVPERSKQMYEEVARIKTRYREEFEELGSIVVEYAGERWLQNVQV